jgi:hypothetical protein
MRKRPDGVEASVEAGMITEGPYLPDGAKGDLPCPNIPNPLKKRSARR